MQSGCTVSATVWISNLNNILVKNKKAENINVRSQGKITDLKILKTAIHGQYPYLKKSEIYWARSQSKTLAPPKTAPLHSQLEMGQ